MKTLQPMRHLSLAFPVAWRPLPRIIPTKPSYFQFHAIRRRMYCGFPEGNILSEGIRMNHLAMVTKNHIFHGARYNFALFVDDICLESLDHMHSPVVKIMSKQWPTLTPEERNYEVYPGWEDGTTEIGEEDVGWMYMHVGENGSYMTSWNMPIFAPGTIAT